jgi:hypothetical protein
MKAEEIRERQEKIENAAAVIGAREGNFDSISGVCFWMAEIAAQLAEFNQASDLGSIAIDIEKLTKPRWVWFKYNTFRYVVDAREVASVSVPDPNHCVIIMRNEGGPDPGRFCEGTYEEVCDKLGIPKEG